MKMKIVELTYVCDCPKRGNDNDTYVFTPDDPTTVDLLKIKP